MQTLRLENTQPSDVVQTLLRLEGNPYSLKEYPMFKEIFDSPWERRLMKSGRQVSKTITMAADIIGGAALTPYTPFMYTNASAAQTTSFSTSKLDPFLLHSPLIYHNLMRGRNIINNIFSKRFSNFAEVKLTYFSDSADRARGHTAHKLYADEVQDVLYDALIDCEECLSAAPEPRFMYAGTSKTMSSTLEYFWSLSTQKSWIMKCDGCGKWNVPSKENIDLKGLVCKKCRALLNPYAGMWHAFNQGSEDKLPLIDGFHIPQIILPMHCQNPTKWGRLLDKLDNYPEYKFLNEVMGLPLGEGDSPITEALLKSICIEDLAVMERICAENQRGASMIVGGADWGGSGMTGTSRTVLSVYAVFPERAQVVKIFGRIYSGGEPTKHIEDIAKVCNDYNISTLYGDHGGGNFAMSQLSALVPNTRVVPVMYTEQSMPYRWDNAAQRFTVNRTAMIDAFFHDMKRERIKAFRWSEFQPFAKDILNVYEDVVGEAQGKGRRVWRRYPAKPDDSLHSMLYGWMAGRVVSGLLDFAH